MYNSDPELAHPTLSVNNAFDSQSHAFRVAENKERASGVFIASDEDVVEGAFGWDETTLPASSRWRPICSLHSFSNISPLVIHRAAGVCNAARGTQYQLPSTQDQAHLALPLEGDGAPQRCTCDPEEACGTALEAALEAATMKSGRALRIFWLISVFKL